MKQELSTPQMAVLASVSERTIQRWLRDGKLPSEHIIHNRYRIDTDDLERVRLTDHYEEHVRIVALERRVEQLEATVHDLAELLRQLTTPKPTPRHHLRVATEHTREAIVPNTEGLVPAVQFALQHGVGEDAAKSAYKRQYIKTTQPIKPGPHYLDEQQRRNAITYWQKRNTPGFATCTDPACPCHTG